MEKKYVIVEHPEYGYRHLSPIPSAEEVEKFYREEFYSSQYGLCNDSSQEKKSEDRIFNHGRYEDICAILEGQLGPLHGKSLFDIGCGFGELLLFAQEKGMQVAGMEVVPEAVSFLQGKNISVFLSTIDDTDFSHMSQGKRYSVVTLLNVLEHLREPARTLREIREQLLEPNGVLVVDVPNEFNPLQTAARDVLGLGEWWVAAPVHINYFTPVSLQRLLQACGYEVIDLLSSFPLELFLLMGDVYVGDNILGHQCHKKRVLFEENLRKAGKSAELRDFYRMLGNGGFGRQIVCFGKVDAYSIATSPKQIEG